MKYIKKFRITLLAAAICLGGQSCNKWLDIQPLDQVLENQAFENEAMINDALNGLYLRLANNSLYGRNLSFYTAEILAQRYYIPLSEQLLSYQERYYMVSMDYNDQVAKNHLNTIFSEAYSVILNTNLFIDDLNAVEGVVVNSRKNIMLGEAHALRAFLHFDLLRLFGPMPQTESQSISIAYVTQPDNQWQDRLPLKDVIEYILTDLETAEVFLANDPIRTRGVVTGAAADEDDPEFFYRDYRNRRFNYFAVKALKARLYAYKGDISRAGQIARELIEDEAFEAAFPWTASEYATTDKIYSDEVLFGIHSVKMYEHWERWFSQGITSLSSVLGVSRGLVLYMFNSSDLEGYLNTADWRGKHYEAYTNNNGYLLSTKFKKTTSTRTYDYFQPLLRKTELYLLAAEAYGDVHYLDQVRTHRGLKTADEELGVDSYVLQEEITREFMKETFAEGQLFFYYKRLNFSELRSSTSTTKTVTKSEYVLPIPDAERDH